MRTVRPDSLTCPAHPAVHVAPTWCPACHLSGVPTSTLAAAVHVGGYARALAAVGLHRTGRDLAALRLALAQRGLPEPGCRRPATVPTGRSATVLTPGW